jgi:thiamine biosynthesis lipoprotein
MVSIGKGVVCVALTTAFAALWFLPISCMQGRTERSILAMGTILTITVTGLDNVEADRAIEAAIAEVDRLENLLSTRKPESDLSKLNREAAKGWVIPSAETFRLLQMSLRYSRLTNGAFDVTAGPLVSLWGFHDRRDRRPPSSEELKRTRESVGYDKIEIDEQNKAVRFAVAGMEVDFDGIAKGYTVDKACEVLRNLGVKSGLVDLGGNIYAIGVPPGRDTWRIAVRNPRSNDSVGTLRITEKGVASSGQYVRYVEYENHKYGHIVDPRNGLPVEGVLGTTIVAPDGITADILSTATFVLGLEKAREIIRSEDVEGLLITDDGKGGMIIYVSEGLKGNFELNAALKDTQVEYF